MNTVVSPKLLPSMAQQERNSEYLQSLVALVLKDEIAERHAGRLLACHTGWGEQMGQQMMMEALMKARASADVGPLADEPDTTKTPPPVKPDVITTTLDNGADIWWSANKSVWLYSGTNGPVSKHKAPEPPKDR